MNILITKSTDSTILKYDLFGNVFLHLNNQIYYVSIDSQNNPELMLVKKHKLTDLTEYTIDFTMGKLHSGVPSLKGFIEDEISRKNENDDIDEDENMDMNDDYFPEQKYFYREGGDVDDTNYISSTDVEPMFKFYNHNNNFVTMEGYPSNSLYSFLVVNGNVKSKNIVLLSEEYNDTCSYRITFYTDGNIKCNVVGSCEKMYTLSKDVDNNLTIVSWEKYALTSDIDDNLTIHE